MSDSRRTRSQLTLPDFNFGLVGRSPLKDARIAIRTNANAMADDQVDHNMLPATDSDDEMRLSPSPKRQVKRPPSPLKDSGAQRERELKRARHDDFNAENETMKSSAHPFISTKKAASASPVLSPKKDPLPAPSFSRAQSVPLEGCNSIPHLDLNHVPPSPWRSPSKAKLKLLITAMPVMATIPDDLSSAAGATALPSPSRTEHPADAIKSPKPPEGIDKERSMENTLKESSAQIIIDIPLSSPPNPPPTSPLLSSSPLTPAEETPPMLAASSSATPMSPLTPLPPTPFRPKLTVSQHVEMDHESDDPPAHVPEEEPIRRPSRPKTPSAIISRLPRPSSMHIAEPIASSSSNIVPKRPASRAKMKAVKPAAPAIPRMTRSASLRQKEIKKREEANNVVSSAPKTPGRGVSTMKPRQSTHPSRPPSAASSLSSTSHPRPVDPEPLSHEETASPVKIPGTQRRRSLSFSYALPTSSSAAKSNPSSPIKPRSSIAPPLSKQPVNRLQLFSRASQPPPNSSLSNLSMALEKLNLPPPSRPNTSMGFHRDSGETDDDNDDHPRSQASTSSKDDSNIGTSSRTKPFNNDMGLKPAPLKRATTMGALTMPGSSSNKTLKIQSKLMLPPPVPRARIIPAPALPNDDTHNGLTPGAAESSVPAPAKRINLNSGMVSGKAKGGISFGSGIRRPPLSSDGGSNPGNRPRVFGVGALSGLAAKGRVVHKASKASSLPVVEGSPVKGGESLDTETTLKEEDNEPVLSEGGKTAPDEDVFFTTSSTPQAGTSTTPIPSTDVPMSSDSEESQNKGKEKSGDAWKHDASRRASMASQLLSQSLSAMPRTPPRPMGVSSEGKGKGRAGLRAASSSYPSSLKAALNTAPGALGRTSNQRSNGAYVSAKGKAVAREGGMGTSTVNGTPGSAGSGSVRVLKECTIYVDVRTDDGDDAGGLFVDMLKGMGAKMLTRVGQTCTHIVYKNGLMSTLTRYRLLHEPRPLVVGIAWVVECVEQRARVDETKFLIDLEGVNVAGMNKRRRSMLPKQLTPSTSTPESRGSMVSPAACGASDRTRVHNNADRSVDMTTSPITDVGDSPAGEDATEKLPPLERARRRQSTLFGRS